jgi:tetratricopeptide (TPR) repeat protein
MKRIWHEPVFLSTYFNDGILGSACGGLGDYDEAEVYLRRALELNPDHAVANYSLGLALERKNNLDAAIHHFTRALTDNLLQAEAYVCLGGIYIQKGMLDTAITQLRKALLINPDLASAQGLIAKAQRLCEEVNR